MRRKLCPMADFIYNLLGEEEPAGFVEGLYRNAFGAYAALNPNGRIERTVLESFRTLGEREEHVLRHRFGLEARRQTLAEIADYLGVSAMRVRQIEQKALRKMRHPSRSGKIQDALRREWVGYWKLTMALKANLAKKQREDFLREL